MNTRPAAALEIHALTPERRLDFLRFFEGPAFEDNPKWKSCFCQFLYVDHSKVVWLARTAEQNRSAACERIAGGQMQGYLAYRASQVVAWCSAGPRLMMDAFAAESDPNTSRIGQISCFVVAPKHRRSGVAKALLAAACTGLKAQGLIWAEASPKPELQGDAENHYGPLSLYTAAGFQFHRQGEHGCVILRKRLF